MVLNFLYICNRLWHSAQMVKLVDTPAWGAGSGYGVQVRVLFWAPWLNKTRWNSAGFVAFWERIGKELRILIKHSEIADLVNIPEYSVQ